MTKTDLPGFVHNGLIRYHRMRLRGYPNDAFMKNLQHRYMVWVFETDDLSRDGYIRADSVAHAFAMLGTTDATLWQIPNEAWQPPLENGIRQQTEPQAGS